MRYGDETGFTVIEVVVTIALIGIAVGLTSLGLRSIFNSSVSSYASQLANDIRLVASREMASSNNDYELIISYDSDTDRYTIRSYVEHEGEPRKVLKSTVLPKAIRLSKDGVELSDDSYGDVETRSFRFSPSSGALVTEGDGTYTVSSVSSHITRDVVVIRYNGRVYIDE